MASTPVILLLKRTGNSSDRPNTVTVQAGEPPLIQLQQVQQVIL
jgi:hypothetical protein